jgi:alpha-L-rhamnosidase
VALAWGLVPPEHEQAVLESVVADIQARGNHLNTGAIGTKEILPVLTDNGYGDLASAVASQTTYPSWGYWFQKLGASAMWEGWEWTARSRSHAMLGTVDDWFYTHLAGIAPLRAGYEVVRVKPFVPSSGLNWTAAQIQTVRGRVGSLWVRHDQRVGLRVEIPANATGEIWVPTSDPSTVMEGGQPVQQVSGVTFLKFEDGYAVYTVGSGTYSFLSTR